MSARQWRSDGGETLREGHSGYVQVVGHLDTKTQSGSNNVLIVKSIRALDDPADRLFFHLMQAAFVTLCFERGPPVGAVFVTAYPARLTPLDRSLLRFSSKRHLDLPPVRRRSRVGLAAFLPLPNAPLVLVLVLGSPAQTQIPQHLLVLLAVTKKHDEGQLLRSPHSRPFVRSPLSLRNMCSQLLQTLRRGQCPPVLRYVPAPRRRPDVPLPKPRGET